MSAFNTYKKVCACGFSVPPYIVPATCFYCTGGIAVAKVFNPDRKKPKPKPRITYVLCSGICDQKVPTHATPDKCRYCAKYKICDGICKKYVNISTTPNTCPNCDLIRFPYVKCETECCANQVRKDVKCKTCANQDRKDTWLSNLIYEFGTINPDYAIKIGIKGIGSHHTGHSCLTPFGVEDVEIDHTICLPAFESVIPECEEVSDGISSPIHVRNFKKNRVGTHYDMEPVIKFYVKELNLKRIKHPGTCGCDGLPNEPHVKTISVVDKDTAEEYEMYDFYDLRDY